MASSLMSAGGLAAAGPLGSVGGALLGSVIDGAIGKGRARREGLSIGPDSSDYGSIIPRIFGRMRTAGLLIWATPMRRSGGGKGGGQRSYVVSFAIALSSAPVRGIGRIWADGREIRDAAGQFRDTVTMRVHSAYGTAFNEPLFQIEESADSPDYRGLSFVLFEDFDVGSFGNRIPLLEFEVEADDDGAGQGRWLGDLSAVAPDQSLNGSDIKGFIAANPDVHADIELLSLACGYRPGREQAQASWRDDAAVVSLASADVLSSELHPQIDQFHVPRDNPSRLSIGYAEVGREYLAGEQLVDGRGNGAAEQLALPMAMDAGTARSIGARLIGSRAAEADRLKLGLSWKHLALDVGDRLRLDQDPQVWDITRRTVEQMCVVLECRRLPERGTRRAAGDGGRSLPDPVFPPQTTRAVVEELIVEPDGGGKPGLWIGVGAPEQWPGATVVSAGSERGIGELTSPIVTGALIELLAPAAPDIWDEHNVVIIRLDHDDMWLESRNALSVLGGANLARVGDEIIQYRSVEPLSEQVFRLSGLLRSRLGSVSEKSAKPAGTRFHAIDFRAMTFLDVGADALGAQQELLLRGRWEPSGGRVISAGFQGLGLAPLAPCHLGFRWTSSQRVVFSWVARDRRHWSWAAGETDTAQTWRATLYLHDVAVKSILTSNVQWEIEDKILLDNIVSSNSSIRLEVETLGDGPQHFRTVSREWGLSSYN